MGLRNRSTVSTTGLSFGRADDLTAVLDRLARAGYARAFRVLHGQVWCGSCESAFQSEDVVVDAEIAITRESGPTGTVVYGLRCLSCGAKGTWVLTDPGADEQELISRLRRVDTAVNERGLMT
jgi:hypothetical protein